MALPYRTYSITYTPATTEAGNLYPKAVMVDPYEGHADDAQMHGMCFRCRGTGQWKGGIRTGICFDCRGTGERTQTETLGEARKEWERRFAKEAAKQDASNIEGADLMASLGNPLTLDSPVFQG